MFSVAVPPTVLAVTEILFPAGAFRRTVTFATSSFAVASSIKILGAGSSSSIIRNAVLLSNEALIGFDKLIMIVSLSSLDPSLRIGILIFPLVEPGANCSV